ncbi:uncharacterized protein LOC118587195 [Onychomys torridus]|uniref:uncharacterized protein LOC118587195 n=1 Tax=Onychomys torridus TaxID=38674 RepID=UPI00167F4764|nr:uncharacterized protein LOC118587195 [Onychomys torridus]
MAPSLRTARASGRARRSRAGGAVRVGLTGPSRSGREGASACSIAPSSWRALRARTESPSPSPGPCGTRVAGSARLGHLCAPVLSWSQGNFVAFSIRRTGRVGCSTPSGLGCGVLAGPVAKRSGCGRLSCRCCVGRFGPWLLVSWQRHRTKSPEPWGVPEVDAWVYFPSGPTGSLPSRRIPKPAQSPYQWLLLLGRRANPALLI